MSTPQVFYSAELRWWGTGYLPQPVTNALQQLPGQDQAPRLDRYVMQHTALSSIKWREGALEVKSMTADPTELEPPLERFGPVTFWEKWRLPGKIELEGAQWLSVHKYRTLAFYHPKEGWLLQSPTTPIPAGCQLEWSKVEVKGRTYWSLGLEAFDEAGLQGAEALVTSTFIKLMEGISELEGLLRHAQRLDYPRWLRQFSSSGDLL